MSSNGVGGSEMLQQLYDTSRDLRLAYCSQSINLADDKTAFFENRDLLVSRMVVILRPCLLK